MDNMSEPSRRTVLAATAAAGAFGLAASMAQSAEEGGNTIRPFRVNIPEAKLVDLRRRIAATQWPEKETVADESQGVQLATMQELSRYWAADYDWRKCEAKLNALPQFMTEIDGLDIHFLRVRSKHENALPLIVTHGWPASYDHRRKGMAKVTYDKQLTALLVLDPYNDFISEGGKILDRIRAVAEANGCVPHMLQVLTAARRAKLRVFYVLHHRYRPGDYETWKYVAPIQRAAWRARSFEYGTWGGEIRAEFEPEPGEIVATEHWCSSGFANTDLDLQLKKHGIHQLIVIGLVEATVRYAAELGYQVTVVRDATADYSEKEMHAAPDVNLQNYAPAIVSTDEIVASISALEDFGTRVDHSESRASAANIDRNPEGLHR